MTNPETVLISNLNKIIDKPIDIFICSGSFESRSLEVAQAIGPKNVKKAISQISWRSAFFSPRFLNKSFKKYLIFTFFIIYCLTL